MNQTVMADDLREKISFGEDSHELVVFNDQQTGNL